MTDANSAANVTALADKRQAIVHQCVCGCQYFYVNVSRFKHRLALECVDCGSFAADLVVATGDPDAQEVVE